MAEDLERRVQTLERAQDRLANALEQINSTLKRFEEHIDELFNAKSKLDSIDVMWRRIDDVSARQQTIDKEFHLLKAEHTTCKPLVDAMNLCKGDTEHRLKSLELQAASNAGFQSRLWGSILEKAIWYVIAGGALAAVYLAGKGVFKTAVYTVTSGVFAS